MSVQMYTWNCMHIDPSFIFVHTFVYACVHVHVFIHSYTCFYVHIHVGIYRHHCDYRLVTLLAPLNAMCPPNMRNVTHANERGLQIANAVSTQHRWWLHVICVNKNLTGKMQLNFPRKQGKALRERAGEGLETGKYEIYCTFFTGFIHWHTVFSWTNIHLPDSPISCQYLRIITNTDEAVFHMVETSCRKSIARTGIQA